MPAVLFVGAYMRTKGRERWSLVLPLAAAFVAAAWALFDRLLARPWPPSVLGDAFPGLAAYIPSLGG